MVYFGVNGFSEELQETYNPGTSAWVLVDWDERSDDVDVTYCEDSDVQFLFDDNEVSKDEFQKSLGLTDEEVKQIIDETIASAGHEAHHYKDSVHDKCN